MKPLNIFYEEPDNDRWFFFDRYPRRILRKIIRRKKGHVGGHRKVFINLCKGLDKIGIPYRVNDFRYIKKNTNEFACIVGKPFLLHKVNWQNPILFGASVFSHPVDELSLFDKFPVKKVLVPGDWMKNMWSFCYDKSRIESWPVGIDTEHWYVSNSESKTIDFLIYDKIRWNYENYKKTLLNPIIRFIEEKGFDYKIIRYGDYTEDEYLFLLKQCKAMIFLCEHETQGIAYQEALSSDVPIFAWDRGGFWKDPSYYPHLVKYEPVSSVPYWDLRCGLKFKNFDEFKLNFDDFYLNINKFSPRSYILENLTLEKSAQNYLSILSNVQT